MSKDIKEYLHFYLGCEVLVLDTDGQTFKDRVEAVKEIKGVRYVSIYEFGDCPLDNHEEYYQELKPILRKLESMTEEEASALNDEMYGDVPDFWQERSQLLKTFINPWPLDDRPAFPVYVKAINWLRSKGFDCDELIENGLAIDKETIK